MAASGSLLSVLLVIFCIPHIPKQKQNNQSEGGFDFKKIFEIMFSKGDPFPFKKIFAFETFKI